ncbi:MAG: 7TM diverse intracellular signaling domain-containing protein [Ginsengibacter sp.]
MTPKEFSYNCYHFISFFSFNGCKAKYLFIFLFASIAAGSITAQPFSFTDSTAHLRINGSPDEVARHIRFEDVHFSKEAGNYINYGIAGNEYKYFVLKLSSLSEVNGRFLSIDNTSLDTIDIYRIYANGKSELLYQGGYLVPYSRDRAYVWHTIPVEISVIPSYYLVAMKAAQKNINIQYDILSDEALQRKYQAHDRYVFFYIGSACLIIVTMVLAFFLFRQKTFTIYLGYIICISIWIIAHYGYLFPFVYPRLPAINEIVKPVSSLGAAYFLIALLNNVFSQSLQSKVWLKQMLTAVQYVLPVICGLMLLLLINNLAPSIQGALIALWHVGLLFAICLIVFTPLDFINTGRVAKIFSCAMLLICIIALVHLLGNSGYINNYFINEHGITIGSIIENFIIAFGLLYGLFEENNEKKKRVLMLEQEQGEILKRLVTVQDNERKRIANDLHDNIGPLLAALKINFRRLIDNKDALQNGLVHKTESIIDDSILEIRNVAHNLMPKSLTSNGLIKTLREYFEELEQIYSKKIIFNHDVQSILQPDIQMNLYRIICELVLNAVKHSDATELIVCIHSNEVCVTVSIKDDGKGFNIKSADFRKSFGLQSAESRMHYMKGKFVLKTSPGKGTVIDMEIPL